MDRNLPRKFTPFVQRNRLIIVLGFIGLFAICIIGKLFLLQVVHGNEFTKRADRQYAPSQTSSFDRGAIYATTKDGIRVELATVSDGFKLTVVPDQIVDPENVYQEISKIIPLDHDNFIARASKKGDPYEEITNHITKENADSIQALNIKGVNLFRDAWRSYPGDTLASKVVGFLGYKGDLMTGRYGLEKYYNSVLLKNQSNLYSNFFAEVFENFKNSFSTKDEGGDLETTLEPTVQAHLEQQLNALKDKYTADEVGGIIMDPHTGDVLAMHALPDYDPNFYGKAESFNNYKNPLVENVYELGSVVKALTMSAGLDTGVVTPETKYDDKGMVVLNGSKIYNFDKKGRGVIDMQEVLNESLNTGAVFVMQKLGHDKMRDYFYRFGLNSKTGIDLPDEAESITSGLTSPRDVEYGNIAFGQGIALTPVAAIRAFSALANNGVPVSPHIVSKIDYTENESKPIPYPANLPQVIKPETVSTISRMLTTVYETGVVGKKFADENRYWHIAAKTGTAQVPKENGGGYYPDKYLHSMVGYFPAYNPKFIVLLYMLNPHNAQYSSGSVAYNFENIAHFLLTYYQVPPDH